MSLFSLKNISRNCFLLLLTITLIVIWGGDAKGQRVYATTSSASPTVTGSGNNPSSSVTNPSNCVSGAGNSAIQPTATPFTSLAAKGGAGVVGTISTAYLNLQFDTAVPTGTIVFVKVSGGPTATQSSTITGAAYSGGASPVTGSDFYLLAGGDGSQYVAIYATASFNSVRINLNAAGSGLLGPGVESVTLSVQYAYYNANGSSAPVDCGLAIGTSKSGNGAVDNMQLAIDGNLTTYSSITPALLLSSVNQNFFFSALSNPTDEIKVTLSVPPMALSLGLANTITVSAYSGSNSTPVWTQTLGTLLSLDLLTLLGNGTPVTTSIKPGVSFDRLTVNNAAVLSVLFTLRVHEVQITAASPVLTTPNPTICANTSTTLVVTAPALSTAKWYDAATGGNLVASGNSFTTPILTTTTTYYVAIVKNGCTEESVRVPALVTVLPSPSITPILGTLTTCVGKTTSLSSSTTGGSWTSSTPAVATIDPVTGIVTGVTAGTSIITYKVTGANNCFTTTTATVTINALPAVPTISGTLTACVGKTTTLTGSPTGGAWSSATPTVATIDPTTGIVTGVTSGTSVITYTVTNANGCTASQTATVTINALPVVNAITGTLTACIGNTTQLSSATSGGVWTSATPAVATVNSSGLVTGVTAGTSLITYTVTNANGCIATQTATVTINALPAIPTISGTLTACVGKTTTLTGSPTAGAWSSATPAVATIDPTTGIVTGVIAGTSVITYTVTNANGCTAVKTTTVTINALPLVNPITGTLSACIGNTTQLSSTTSGGVWTSGTPAVATVNSSGLVTGVTAGTSLITYTVTNANGCIATQTATVTINALPAIPTISGTLTACVGKTTTLTGSPTGGAWSSATPAVATIDPTTGIVTGLTAGTSVITYTVTNGNGCIALQTATVTINALPVVSAITGTLSTCIGHTTQLSSTTSGGVWTSGTPAVAIVSSSGLVTGVTSGTAVITYTVTNGNGCIATQTATITINALPTVPTISGTLSACVGKTTTLTGNPTGGAWSSATPAVATIDPTTGIVTGVTAGTSMITYTVTNANGCTASQTATITINALPVVNPITGTLSACIGNTTQLSSTTSGGVWTSGTPAVATVNSSGLVTGVTAGTSLITYTVTNANGCIATQTATVTINALPAIPTISGTLTACVGKTTTLTGSPTAGAWSSATPAVASIDPTTGIVTGLTAGTSVITYTVTNANGCTASQTTTVTINPLPVVAAITGTLSACIGITTQLSSTTSGGVWSSATPAVATVNSSGLVTGVTAGTSVITYTVTNANGCIATQTATVTINALPVVTAITGTLSACIGNTTQLSSTTSGGVWTSGTPAVASINSSGLVTGLTAGTSLITYTVTNGNGCVATQTTTVTINALPVVAPITGTMSTCIGKTTQLANTTSSGVWSSVNPTIATVNSAGLVTGVAVGTATINYTVTNSNGCITIVTTSVAVHLQPALPAISQKNLCLGQSIDLNTLNPSDGNGTTGGTYSWSAIAAGGTPLSATLVSPALGNTTYYLRYTKDGCFSDSSVLIIMHPKPPTPHVTLN